MTESYELLLGNNYGKDGWMATSQINAEEVPAGAELPFSFL